MAAQHNCGHEEVMVTCGSIHCASHSDAAHLNNSIKKQMGVQLLEALLPRRGLGAASTVGSTATTTACSNPQAWFGMQRQEWTGRAPGSGADSGSASGPPHYDGDIHGGHLGGGPINKPDVGMLMQHSKSLFWQCLYSNQQTCFCMACGAVEHFWTPT